jgi:hypothetical protein
MRCSLEPSKHNFGTGFIVCKIKTDLPYHQRAVSQKLFFFFVCEKPKELLVGRQLILGFAVVNCVKAEMHILNSMRLRQYQHRHLGPTP